MGQLINRQAAVPLSTSHTSDAVTPGPPMIPTSGLMVKRPGGQQRATAAGDRGAHIVRAMLPDCIREMASPPSLDPSFPLSADSSRHLSSLSEAISQLAFISSLVFVKEARHQSSTAFHIIPRRWAVDLPLSASTFDFQPPSLLLLPR